VRRNPEAFIVALLVAVMFVVVTCDEAKGGTYADGVDIYANGVQAYSHLYAESDIDGYTVYTLQIGCWLSADHEAKLAANTADILSTPAEVPPVFYIAAQNVESDRRIFVVMREQSWCDPAVGPWQQIGPVNAARMRRDIEIVLAWRR
jgi:hypothetical protein